MPAEFLLVIFIRIYWLIVNLYCLITSQNVSPSNEPIQG